MRYSRSCASEAFDGSCAHSGTGPKPCRVQEVFHEGDDTDVLCPRCISHFRKSRTTLVSLDGGRYRCPECEEEFEAHDWLEMYSGLVHGLLEEIAEFEADNRKLRGRLGGEGKRAAA